MKLYHGTSDAFKEAILSQGITPRMKRRSNWAHAPSRPDAVYLTNCYAPYFAAAATKKNQLGLIVEIETDKLEQWRLTADEDVLEQAGRGRDKVPHKFKDDTTKQMNYRTEWYRKRLENWAGTGAWKQSLDGMGTCAYLGTVPVTAITRMLTIDDESKVSCLLNWDASITLLNYRILGENYQKQTARIFGDLPNVAPEGDDVQSRFADVRIPFKGTLDIIQSGRIVETKELDFPEERRPFLQDMGTLTTSCFTGAP